MRGIPKSVLRHSIELKICTEIDVFEKPTYQTIEINNVCIQPAYKTIYPKDNLEQACTAVCFVDKSSGIDVEALVDSSVKNGHPALLVFKGKEYGVVSVDVLYDDYSNLHHYEVYLA